MFNSDNSNGDFNSLSINSLSPNDYVIDRGKFKWRSRGFKKIMIESGKVDSVSIKISILTILISKLYNI